MKKLIFKTLVLTLPFIAGFIYMEYYCRTETTFAKKRDYINHHAPEVEVLALGSSHCQDGIDPDALGMNTANMAFGGQTFSIDHALFKKYAGELSAAKWLIIDVSPHRFFLDIIEKDWNHRIYRVMYGIRYKTEDISADNYSLVLSDFSYFSNVVWQGINPWGYKTRLTEKGFPLTEPPDRFAKLNYDTAAINHSFSQYYRFADSAMYRKNLHFLNEIMSMAEQKHMRVLLLSTPVYYTFYSTIPAGAKKMVNKSLEEMVHKYPNAEYLNMMESKEYDVRLFKNDNHLNLDGAKRMTLFLKEKLREANTDSRLGKTQNEYSVN